MKKKGLGPSQRCLKVGEEIRRLLAAVFQENIFWDETIHKTPITITEVRLSPDLRHARVFFLPLGGDQQEDFIRSLTKESGRIRKLLSQKLRLRVTPDLHFQVDHSFDQGKTLDLLLKQPQVLKDLESEE